MDGLRGLRALVLHLTQVALAIQGMTPDANDLASPALPRILRALSSDPPASPSRAGPRLVLGSERLAALPAPREDDRRNEAPDEVCAPPSAGARLVFRDPSEGRFPLGMIARFPDESPTAPRGTRPPAVPGRHAPAGARLHTLCRMTC